MIDIFDKGSALGNVFNKAVSSADGGNSVRAGEGAEPDGAEKFDPAVLELKGFATKDAFRSIASGKSKQVRQQVRLALAGHHAALQHGHVLPAAEILEVVQRAQMHVRRVVPLIG